MGFAHGQWVDGTLKSIAGHREGEGAPVVGGARQQWEGAWPGGGVTCAGFVVMRNSWLRGLLLLWAGDRRPRQVAWLLGLRWRR